jgi:hypothetical protein
VPLAATPLTTATITAGGTTMCYSVPTGSYARDFILTNANTSSGTAFTVFVGTGSGSTSTAAGMGIPAGQQMLIQGPLAGGTQIYATCVSAATLVVGQGSVVSVI